MCKFKLTQTNLVCFSWENSADLDHNVVSDQSIHCTLTEYSIKI